jgi:RNA polymerase sigma-70 factor, ECF subfamily
MEATKKPRTGSARLTSDLVEDVYPSTTSNALSAEQVYHDYAPRVYNMARRMVSNDNDAEDVTQDVLLQVVRKLPTFRGDAAFPTWLHRVTVNAALSHRRRRAVREAHTSGPITHTVGADDLFVEECPGRSPEPSTQMLEREAQQLIERAIASLPEVYRTVFVLSEVEGWSNADIGSHLHLSLPAVKSRLHRARLLMRDALAPHFDDAHWG